MQRHPLQFVMIIALTLPALTAPASGGQRNRNAQPFEEVEIIFELNETDEDAEVVISANSDTGIRRFWVKGPNGRTVVNLTSNDFARLGLSEIAIESAEPNIESVKKAYPEGKYTFHAVTVDGKHLRGQAELSHDLLPAPEFSPQEGKVVDPANVIVEWQAVPGAESYVVEVQQDELEVEFTVEVGPQTLSVSVPPELLVPGVEYEVGVATVTGDGNLAVAESTFVTSLEPGSGGDCPRPAGFSDFFFPGDCKYVTDGANTFFILQPGYRLVLAGEDDGADLRVEITVLDETEVVDGVTTRVVEERETEDGELVEISRNFFALCEQTGDLYYFGEDVDIYEDGEVVSHEGAWRAGVNNARPGVLVPGSPMIGARHFQEIAPGVALDRSEVIAVLDSMEVEAGEFNDVLFVFETSGLNPLDETLKHYAPGVGLIKDNEVELVEFGFDD